MARASLGPGLDGILVVAKPAGPTSHDVVALVRRLAATKRVGHGGTLDPFASGVLPVFLGHGTRLVEYHLADRKGYRATICFGASSTTDDLEGELSPATGPAPDRARVEAAFAGSVGTVLQRPPAFSAIKVAGRRAYAVARAGETVTLAPREVTFHSLELASWDDSDPDRPVAVVDVDLLGRDVRARTRARYRRGGRVGCLPRCARAHVVRPVRPRVGDPARHDPHGRGGVTSRDACRSCCPSMPGSRTSPRSSLPRRRPSRWPGASS